jgi:hypothetical protein
MLRAERFHKSFTGIKPIPAVRGGGLPNVTLILDQMFIERQSTEASKLCAQAVAPCLRCV